MAADTILTIIRDFAPRVGVGKPTTATGSTDVQVQQMVALANEEGQELAARFDWQQLILEATWTSVATEDQGALSGTIVSAALGFNHILNDTIWNRTTKVGPGGPLSPVAWQANKATSYTGPYSQYRIRGGHLLLLPAPAAGETLAFEYVSENWVSNTTGDATSNAFVSDDDYPLLDSRLIKLGLIWRWKAAKGLDYSQEFQNYELAVADAKTRNIPRTKVSMNGPCDDFQPFIQVARGNWMQ